jgi:hypothetical protein
MYIGMLCPEERSSVLWIKYYSGFQVIVCPSIVKVSGRKIPTSEVVDCLNLENELPLLPAPLFMYSGEMLVPPWKVTKNMSLYIVTWQLPNLVHTLPMSCTILMNIPWGTFKKLLPVSNIAVLTFSMMLVPPSMNDWIFLRV